MKTLAAIAAALAVLVPNAQAAHRMKCGTVSVHMTVAFDGKTYVVRSMTLCRKA